MMNNPYLVVVKEEFVRDTQYAVIPDADISSDTDWYDTTGSHVIGVFYSTNPKDAIRNASKISNCSEEVLGAYSLAFPHLMIW